MNFFQSLILGIVEGATEYLPVSSTFHLIWTSKLLGIPTSDFMKAFEVIIQAGAILAVVVLYFSVVVKRLELVKKVVISFVPTAVVGLVLYRIIKNVFFESSLLQLSVFILFGFVFVLYERFGKGKLSKSLQDITYKEAILIGLAQSLAVIPGVSRAGAVILFMMLLRVKRADAALYSFLLAVPTILAASGLDFIKLLPTLSTVSSGVLLLAIGFITSFVSALFVVKWFIKYLQKNTLEVFGWYRVVLGLFIIVLILFKL